MRSYYKSVCVFLNTLNKRENTICCIDISFYIQYNVFQREEIDMLDTIRKRDGRTVPFDPDKITNAIMKAFEASHSAKTLESAEEMTREVIRNLDRSESIGVPSVEEVQDMVESVLIEHGFVRTAKRATSSTAPSAAASAK